MAPCESWDVSLAFIHSVEDDIPTHRFLTSGGRGVIDQHWRGLYEPWDLDPEENPFNRFAVNNNNGEEMAVYQGLAWELTAKPVRLAILHYEADLMERWFGRVPDAWVKWEYFVDPEVPDPQTRDEGFRQARTANHPWGRQPEGAAAYLVNSRDELRDLVLASLSDAWGELTLFGLDEHRLSRTIAELNADRQPKLNGLLEDGDRMVHLTFGVDLGYFDSIVVAGLDSCDKVEIVADQFRRAANAYEAKVSSIGSVQEFLVALSQLRRAEAPAG